MNNKLEILIDEATNYINLSKEQIWEAVNEFLECVQGNETYILNQVLYLLDYLEDNYPIPCKIIK